MRTVSKTLLSFVAVLLLAQPGWGQNVTTGTLRGVVMDAQQGVLPGATVVAVHTPTGTTYEAITQADGHFTMLAVRIGGPYTVKASMAGFKVQEQTGINVGLGESRAVDFTLPLESVTETITVTAETQVIDTSRAGTAANVSEQVLESLPTISRSINDFARTSPFFAISSAAAGNADALTVAGRNNRYNNMQIDGAVNNDVFGLADTGTPGGQTGTQPISLDAIQELQLVVSPYDVRQGGFSGGGINAVTKSGSNSLRGSAFFVGRNQNYIGKIPGVATPAKPSPGDTKVGAFSDKQMGFSVGGPIVRNKAFFFTNFDWGRKNTPSGFSADGSTGQQFSGGRANVEQVVAIAKAKYGYDAGSLSEFSKPNNSDKIFARADFNLSSSHQLTARVNYVDAEASIGNQSGTAYKMPSNFYNMTDKMVSSVVQLNSAFGAAFNEFRLTYSRERNVRGGQPGDPIFPEVRVDFADGTYMQIGTEYSSHANKLNQDIVQLSDDVTV
ncbi:MAG TPA: carboxypeptidase-like regulatory domain-containing protein, partial [Vicinamibacterales bacterium]|nr:carboxypeptidase-like regulatory domain-containing protein [Vicinamibacterales bacterium]